MEATTRLRKVVNRNGQGVRRHWLHRFMAAWVLFLLIGF